jgi:hypothetical protein
MKIYNNTGRMYLKGGHKPVAFTYTRGGNIGTILAQSTKGIGKLAVPLVKKAWSSLTPEMRNAIVQGGVDLGMDAARFVGRRANAGIEALGATAKSRLESVLGRSENTSKLSAEAEKMLKTMVKKGKREIQKKKKKAFKKTKPVSALPKEVQSALTKQQKAKINKASMSAISALLSGQGLKVLN